MCSIFGIFGLQPGDDIAALRRQALELSQKQRHRGPDWSGVYHDEGAILVHERLAIVDPAGGSQPLRSADGELVLAVNGAALDDPNRGLEILRGVGQGSAVTLTVERGGQQQQITVDPVAVAQDLQAPAEPVEEPAVEEPVDDELAGMVDEEATE